MYSVELEKLWQRRYNNLTVRERARFDLAIAQGYLFSKPESAKLTWAYFYHQEAEDLPFIEIRPRQKYATVVIDLIGCRELDIQQVEQVRKFLESEWKAGYLTFSPSLCSASRIPLDRARYVASQLLDIWKGREGNHGGTQS